MAEEPAVLVAKVVDDVPQRGRLFPVRCAGFERIEELSGTLGLGQALLADKPLLEGGTYSAAVSFSPSLQ